MPRKTTPHGGGLKKLCQTANDYLTSPDGAVFFFDEARFGLKPHIGRMWARCGQHLSAVVRPGYKNFYLYAAVNPRHGDSFILQLPWVQTEMVNLYLEQLATAFADKRVLLIWDQAGYHRLNNLKVPANIHIVPLPPYSPELNPVEHLWQWLRRHVCRNLPHDSLDELEQALSEQINQLTTSDLSTLRQCTYLLHYK